MGLAVAGVAQAGQGAESLCTRREAHPDLGTPGGRPINRGPSHHHLSGEAPSFHATQRHPPGPFSIVRSARRCRTLNRTIRSER